MTETPPEQMTPDERLQNALAGFTGCIGNAVDDICSYGLTIGESYVPFDPDPEDKCDTTDMICSQVWVRVMDIQPKSLPESFGGDSCAIELSMNLEVGVIRCFNIEEEGEAPTATEVMAAAFTTMEDMRKIMCAALACEEWESIDVGQWTPLGPLGGQYGGIWSFSVEL